MLGDKKMKNLYYYWIILRSGLFNPRFYLLSYPDVRRADVDPLMHYLKFGWKEGRNPNSNFDTNFYKASCDDVKKINICPLAHYLIYGVKEGGEVNPHLYMKSNTENRVLVNENLWIDNDILTLISDQLAK